MSVLAAAPRVSTEHRVLNSLIRRAALRKWGLSVALRNGALSLADGAS